MFFIALTPQGDWLLGRRAVPARSASIGSITNTPPGNAYGSGGG
jgi:hypothetical protein